MFKAWKEGLANKDFSKFGQFFAEDFQFVLAAGTRDKQETLDWTAAAGNPTAIDSLEILYENDEVAVIYYNANKPNVVMAL